jgi:shikimate kinase
VLDELTRREGVLVATGGGAILDAGTRENLRRRGCVVYLRTSVGQQLARTRRGDQRPLLKNDDPRGTLERLMQQRAPLYEEIADLTVDTDGRRVAAVVEEIATWLAATRGA